MSRSGPLAAALVMTLLSGARADPSSASKQTSTEHASVVQALDDVLATKCRVFTQSDCAHPLKPLRARLFEQLGGKSGKMELPKDARRDATAGVFI